MLVLSNKTAISKPKLSARECVVASHPHMTALVKEFGCTAHGLRIACNGEHDPHVPMFSAALM